MATATRHVKGPDGVWRSPGWNDSKRTQHYRLSESMVEACERGAQRARDPYYSGSWTKDRP